MCGICGFVGDPNGIDATAMLESVGHRGPDGSGQWQDDMVGSTIWLGHSRLAILDPTPAGAQPMISVNGRFAISYNGEIYNFAEIRTELTKLGYAFRTRTDTEVILNAWDRWGLHALSRMRGMFAFALWDRSKRHLWLARDRMGEKPLYYHAGPRRLLFASSVTALLASGAIERRIDSDGLDAYLTFGSAADPHTLVRGVRALEAGQLLLYRDGGFSLERYWSIRNIAEETAPVRFESAVTEVGEALRESCRLSIVSDVPVAVLLSGGIDSSSNVALLTEQGLRDFATFSVIFDGPDRRFSEERWSSLVASKFGTRHHKVSIDISEARGTVPRAVAAMDQPTHDGVNTYLVAGAVRAAGFKVAVSGQGSDELFLGYHQRHLFPWLMKLSRLTCPALRGNLNAITTIWPCLHDSRYEKMFQLLGSPESVAAAYLAQHSVFSQEGIQRLRGFQRPLQTCFVGDGGGTTALGVLSRLELMLYLRNTLLRDGDQMGMAHGVEIRTPFLDHRLVESVLALPSKLLVDSRGAQKPLLVSAVGPALPREIVDRPKQGFALPYDRWLRNGLAAAEIHAVDLGLEPSAVDAVRKRFQAGQNWTRFWTLQVLAAWAQRERMLAPA
jgi:asparagine synthase (glutamine-hydrolysing)